MSLLQHEKAARFRALHAAPGAFVIPNPWDAGSARLLAGMGFSALATSSSASAGTLGRSDYGVTREQALALARAIVEAVNVPVTADLEDGFGAEPESVAETVRLAAGIGLAGCSIEDAPGDGKPHALELATERIAAAAEAVRSLPFPFVLTARAENYVRGIADLDDTIRRLVAYERAGADVLFAPGLPDLAAVRTMCSAVSKPVNVVGSLQDGACSVAQFAEAGVKRISLATALYRAAMMGVRDAAREILTQGTFSFARRIMPSPELNAFMRPR